MHKATLLFAIALSAATAHAQKEVTICEDYVSDGGYSYRLKQASKECQRAMLEASDAQRQYIRDGSSGSRYLSEYYEEQHKAACSKWAEIANQPKPPETIERRCKTYIDNRVKP